MKDKFCLKDMVKYFISSQPEVKKFWKKKSKDLTNKYELENIHDEEKSESDEKLLNKKQKRKNEESEVKNSNTNGKNKNGKVAKKDESEDESEDLNTFAVPAQLKTKKQENGNGSDKTPFKRIDDSLKEILPQSLQDNSYESFMHKTGENYGKQANEKLKFTKGRDFKKEKTKYKNKTAFGGLSISTAVRSIPLDED
jgi:hypothetical protein